MRRDQNQLRVEAALISAVDRKARWTKSYTDLPGNALKFQDEVSDDVANEIAVIPNFANPVKRAANRTVDPAVYDAYLAGRVYWQDRDLERSLLAYQRALRLNPHYAPALAGLASTYLLLGQSPNDVLTAAEAIPKARRCRRAGLGDRFDACGCNLCAGEYRHELRSQFARSKAAIPESDRRRSQQRYCAYLVRPLSDGHQPNVGRRCANQAGAGNRPRHRP